MRQDNTFWMFTHNFTNTGAPLVLADIAREMAHAGLQKQIRLISCGGKHDQRHSTLQKTLSEEGFFCEICDLNFYHKINYGDRVLLNSLAIPEDLANMALSWLENGKIRRLDWFAHEANPRVWLPHSYQRQKLKFLLEQNNFKLMVPSRHTLTHYQQWLGFYGENLNVQSPKVSLNGAIKPFMPGPLPSFDALHLQLTAMAGAGQKGHLWLLNTLKEVLARPDASLPGLRPINLSFIGLEQGPYAAFTRDIIRRGQALLGESFDFTIHGPREDALEAMSKANMSVSCSLEETFSLVSIEAMALGQPLLRNQTGGFAEQLDHGINGFDLGPAGPQVRKEQIELLHNLRDPAIYSNQKLAAMSQAARVKALEFASINYSHWLLGE